MRMKKEIAPSRAGTRTRRTEKTINLNIPDKEEFVND